MKARPWNHETVTPSSRPSYSACGLLRTSTVISRSASFVATEMVTTSPMSPPCSAMRPATVASWPARWDAQAVGAVHRHDAS
jgi:hypothetical protein